MNVQLLLHVILLLFFVSFASCQKVADGNENHSPSAEFIVTPATGDTATVFTFDASPSSDPEQGSDSLLYSWDFSGYHQWTEYSLNRQAHHQYSEAGSYEVGLQVKDKEGWTDIKRHTLVVQSK